jgi:hypothetical protein
LTVNIEHIAKEFTDYLNAWHSLPEVYDNALDAQIHRWYAEVENVWPKRPYFSPSAANSDKRELYMKTLGAKKDAFPRRPYQSRWQRIGTAIGDIIQRDLLFAEKHFERLTGKPASFTFERDAKGRPMFEDFAKTNAEVNHRGNKFYLYGTPDGIMRYVDPETGEVLRIGLEIKSKQTSAAKTSEFSLKEPDIKHVKQTVGYSKMYNVDHYIILYVNASKKSWFISDEDFAKTPDIRAFGLSFTEDDRLELYDYLVDILERAKTKQPPALDLTKWTFNNFKTACAKDLSEEEMAELKEYTKRVLRSNMRQSDKEEIYDAYEFIKETRAKGEAV